jgi:hypothetical protein
MEFCYNSLCCCGKDGRGEGTAETSIGKDGANVKPAEL